MIILPYRVKNPPKRFPFVTAGLIALNVLIFALTSSNLQIREDIVIQYAYTYGTSPFLNFISAAFLHADIFHLLGNMLFLWVFGPAVEDRLGVGRYLLVYLVTGLIGDVSQALLSGAVLGQHVPIIGASGCIMGLMGAYMFTFTWSTVCVFHFIWILIKIWCGVWEIQAVWVIGAYIVMDLYHGMQANAMGISGGVASFAHVGGGVAGLLLCMAMRVKRDSEAVSDAKAVHATFKNLDEMPFHALQTMIEEDPHNLELIRAMFNPAVKLGKYAAIGEAFQAFGPELITKDPLLVAHYLIVLKGDPGIYQSTHLLRLAGLLERTSETDQAIEVYKLLADGRPTDPATETALYRMALCTWNSTKDANTARQYLLRLQKQFPHGDMMVFARQLWNQMQPPKQSG